MLVAPTTVIIRHTTTMKCGYLIANRDIGVLAILGLIGSANAYLSPGGDGKTRNICTTIL
jgi:hypothetical protein